MISDVHVRVKLNLSAQLCREGSKQALVAKAVLSDAMLPCSPQRSPGGPGQVRLDRPVPNS